MADNVPDQQSLLRQEGSDISDTWTAIDLPSPPTLPLQRHPYRRMGSQGSMEDFKPQHTSSIHSIPENELEDDNGSGQSLGIATAKRVSITRVPVGSNRNPATTQPSNPFSAPSTGTINSPRTPQTPGSATALISPPPPWTRHGSGSSYTLGYNGGGLGLMLEDDISKRKTSTFHDNLGDDYPYDDDDQRSRKTRASTINDNDSNELLKPQYPCPTTDDIHTGRASWLSISILVLSIYSTVLSGIWFMLAVAQPRYGHTIHSEGKITPSTASTVAAFFAKTIELSFVTVFITFLGQVLSRRSLIKTSRGVTIAEMTMRTWVVQPGFMITHWQNLQHVGLSLLGIIALTAAVVATFYTTASDALVSPHLKYGRWENKEMYGLVQTSYANPAFIVDSCQTPITLAEDPLNAGSTCLSIEHAGQAWHNYLAYLDRWAQISAAGVGVSSDISRRPRAVGMLFDNTTVTGSWVQTNSSNMTSSYEKYGRIINNATAALPHANIFAAARDAENAILQPADLGGVGEYSIKASVVSPTVNVLCVNMNETELAPLVYVTWPYAQTVNSSAPPGALWAWTGYENDIQVEPGQTYLNSTVVDEIFEWGAEYGRQPPVFPQYPIDYNTITNISVPSSDSIYILAKSPSTTNFTVCQMRSMIYPNCSTRYNVSGITGGNLQAYCDDPSDPDAYSKSVEGAPVVVSFDWRNVISDWSLALSLNTGITNSNSSAARMLTQFIPTVPSWGIVELNPLMPSIAEALAVLSGCTLLLSTTASTFYHFWPYDATILNPGIYQPFNTSMSTQQYTSGLMQNWEAIFYVVLFLVFATNIFCLVYFLVRSGLVTDFTEPQNLFALAINSPPSVRLRGSCGAGPQGDQLNVDWHVQQDENTSHIFIKSGEGGGTHGNPGSSSFKLKRRGRRQALSSLSQRTSYTKLSSRTSSWL